MNVNVTGQFRPYDEWLVRFNALPESAQSAIAESLLGRSLELYINSTEHCNFRCKYCYEDFAIGRMTEVVSRAVKKFIQKNMHDRNALYLNWFGGEPLLAANVILDISQYADDLCSRTGKEFVGGVTTNGYFLDSNLMRKLVACRQSFFQISLDGDQKMHDMVRRRADGEGTFNAIWMNLLELRSTDIPFSILLRLHVHPGNEASLRSLLDKLKSKIGLDERFEVGLHPISNLGGENGGTFGVLSAPDYAEVTSRLISGYSDVLNIANIGGEAGRPGDASCGMHVCYACKGNSFNIRADGRVGKCTVALNKDYNVLGQLNENGEIRLSAEKLRKWSVGMYTLDPQDLSCPLRRGDAYFEDTSAI